MRIPKISSVEKAVEIYYSNYTLGNRQIKELFGGVCNQKVSELKKAARIQMAIDDVPNWYGSEVNTIEAYKAWGIDIDELKNRFLEFRRLKKEGGNYYGKENS